MSQIVIIVDAYSTGRYLAPRFNALGYQCVHVQTAAVVPDIFKDSFCASDFILHLNAGDNIESLLEKLQKYNILAVIPGSETGVMVADYLSAMLKARTNGIKMSSARRNKFEMIEVLKRAGMKTVSHYLAENVAEIIKWQKQLNQTPIVLKPVDSAGSDHVFFCYSEKDIHEAYDAILTNKTIFATKNKVVLAQSFLSGTECIVNTISANGVHYIAEIWQCHKERVEGAGFISLLEELIPFNPLVHTELVDYVKKTLDILEIKHGPGHFEIMVTDSGPILIEVAARLQGCVDPEVVQLATGGDSNVSLTVDAYVDPQKIIEKAHSFYQLNQRVFRVFIKSNVEGILTKKPNILPITKLSSFASLKMNLDQGSQIKVTRDIASSPGVIHLAADNYNRLLDDYKAYQQLEEALFVI